MFRREAQTVFLSRDSLLVRPMDLTATHEGVEMGPFPFRAFFSACLGLHQRSCPAAALAPAIITIIDTWEWSEGAKRGVSEAEIED